MVTGQTHNQIYYLLTFNFKKVSHKTWNIQYDLYCLHDVITGQPESQHIQDGYAETGWMLLLYYNF